MFSMVTVASSTRMPTASARPPSVMIFSVSPTAASTAMDASTASGMEMAMMRVDRRLPKDNRIIRLVSAAASTPSNLAAEWPGHRQARHGDELRPKRVNAQIKKLLLGHGFSQQCQLHNRHCRGVVVQDQRRCRVLR